jgi:hypothetical protein
MLHGEHGVLLRDHAFDQKPALHLDSKPVKKRRAQIGRYECRHFRDVQTRERWASAPHVVRVAYVAIRATSAVDEHRPLQSLVVARTARVCGENDVSAACVPCTPDDAGRYGPIVGGVELLPNGCTPGGHHRFDWQ